MYGTVAKVLVKAGQEQAFINKTQQWRKERGPKVKGNIATYVYQLDKNPREMILVAVFKDKASYEANADDAEQDKWFQEVMEMFEAEPDWNDGEIVVAG